MRSRSLAFAAVVAVLLAVVGCGTSGASNEKQVSKADYGSEWPLTVTSGTLRCESGAVTFTTLGVTYWVNGTAGDIAADHGWSDIDEIWADDPGLRDLGMKISIGPLLDDGLALCPSG